MYLTAKISIFCISDFSKWHKSLHIWGLRVEEEEGEATQAERKIPVMLLHQVHCSFCDLWFIENENIYERDDENHLHAYLCFNYANYF